jgi:hypothetical protein
MFLNVHNQICVYLEDKEQYHHGECGFNPGCRKDRYDNCPEDDGKMHGEDPGIRLGKLFCDIIPAFSFIVTVIKGRVQVVYKEEPAGGPDFRT